MPVPQNETLSAAMGQDRDDAVCRLYGQYDRYLSSLASRKMPRSLRAKYSESDIVQETLIDAWRGWSRFQGTTEPEMRAWLRLILLANLNDAARRFCCSAKRQVNREVRLDESLQNRNACLMILAERHSPSCQAIHREQMCSLQEAMGRLPEPYRRAVLLRHDQLSFAAIGEQLGRSPEAVRKLCTRGIARLQAMLGEMIGQAGGQECASGSSGRRD